MSEKLLQLFPEGGYFVEAGAHDGIGDSQTYALEQTGLWTGLCIEPSSAYRGLTLHRTCRADNRCLWEEDNLSIRFRMFDGNAVELSGILESFDAEDGWDRTTRPHKDIIRQTVKLTTILQQVNAPRTIEFLSLDTEGSELRILQAHDFDQYRFLTATIEHNGVESTRKVHHELMLKQNMQVVRPGEKDDWYAHESIGGTDQWL